MGRISAAFPTSASHGVRFSDVHEASPAAKAGLKAGDVLIEFDGKPIDNLIRLHLRSPSAQTRRYGQGQSAAQWRAARS